MDPQLLFIAAIAAVVFIGLAARKYLGFNPFKGLEKSMRDRLAAEEKSEKAELEAKQRKRRTQTAREIAAAAVANNDKNGPENRQQ